MAGAVGVPTEAGWSFHEKPYRHYEYHGSKTTPPTESDPDGLEILSVTQALGILDKSGPLQGYAARETLVGCSEMLKRAGFEKDADGLLPVAVDLEDVCLWADDPQYFGRVLHANHLTFRQRTSDAAARGTAMHTVLEDWIERGLLPNPKKHAEARRGYVRGLGSFLIAHRPTFLESEMIVGSTVHGVAGARDTVLVLHDPQRGRSLIDLKTSKGVYPSSHFRQLTAYDRLGVECGEQPTDSQGILRVGADGSWEIQWLQDFDTPDFFWRAFLNALAACRDERRIIARGKAIEKEAKARVKAELKAQQRAWTEQAERGLMPA
jgi:hypothetical protein